MPPFPCVPNMIDTMECIPRISFEPCAPTHMEEKRSARRFADTTVSSAESVVETVASGISAGEADTLTGKLARSDASLATDRLPSVPEGFARQTALGASAPKVRASTFATSEARRYSSGRT